jgi:hypothetical protein
MGHTTDREVLEFTLDPGAPPIRFLRIETVASPSWVAWSEIEVFAAE